jgi:4-amino-4-deoxy-L-arabinose transferase-like glycosyltransferase
MPIGILRNMPADWTSSGAARTIAADDRHWDGRAKHRNTPVSFLNNRMFLLLLAGLAVFSIFLELGRMDVYTANESQRATPPAEMLRSGDFIVPTLNGATYIVKPPLLYWAIAGVYRTSGVISEWTARVPTAVCGVLLVLAVYLAGRRLVGEKPARWGALAWLTAPYCLERSRWAELDIPLTLFVFLSVMTLHAACTASSARTRWLAALGSGLALAAAAMLKGPPAYVFVLCAWLALLLLRGDRLDRVLYWGLRLSAGCLVLGFVLWPLPVKFPLALALFVAGWGFLAFRYAPRGVLDRHAAILAVVLLTGLALPAPWAMAALNQLGWPYLSDMLHNQVLERTYVASRINSGSPVFFLLNMLALAGAWALLFPFHFSRAEWNQRPASYRFCVLFTWLAVGVFSLIAGKEREYILPVIPIALMATGFHIAELNRGRHGLHAPWMIPWARWWTRLITIIAAVALPAVALVFTITERHPLLWAEVWVLAAVGLAVAWTLRHRHAPPQAVIIALLLPLTVSVLVGRSYHYHLDQWRSPRVLSYACRALMDEGLTLEATPRLYPVRAFQFEPMAFYIGRPVPLEDMENIAPKLGGQEPYYYLTKRKLYEQHIAPVAGASVSVVLENRDTVVLGNHPPPDLPEVEAAREVARRRREE